jgi:hypothetical protein
MFAFVRAVEVALLTPWLVAIALLVLALRSDRSRRGRVWLLVGVGLFVLLGLAMFWAAIMAF